MCEQAELSLGCSYRKPRILFFQKNLEITAKLFNYFTGLETKTLVDSDKLVLQATPQVQCSYVTSGFTVLLQQHLTCHLDFIEIYNKV